MHQDLSTHLHTEECNKLIEALARCHIEKTFITRVLFCQHPYLKFAGYCNDDEWRMSKCLKKERVARRAKNHQKAEERLQRQIDATKAKRGGDPN